MDKSESIIDTDSVIEDGNYRDRDDFIDLRTTFSVLDLSNKVIGLFDKKTEINQFLVNHYMKNINSCRMTEMFGSTKFERTDTLFYGKIHHNRWSISFFYGDKHYFYQNFNVKEIYKDIPQIILHLKDWYIGNNQIIRGYFDTDDECDTPVYATVFSFNPKDFQLYYATEFKDKSPEQVSEMLSLAPFYQDDITIRHNYADGIYQSWIDPKYASDGDTLKYIVWRIDDGASYLELLYKEIEHDSLIMVGGDWFNGSTWQIDWDI